MTLLAPLALTLSLMAPQQHALAVPAKRAQILLVGCYHFSNPGLDVVKAPLDDHLSPKRQAEIEQLDAKLATFKPTKVLVEERFGNLDTTKRFLAWTRGERKLTVNETEQIGFRVARAAGLNDVVPIDHKLDMDFDGFLKKAPPAVLAKFQAAIGQAQKMMEGLSQHTVAENLRMFNSPEADHLSNGLYLSMLPPTKDGDYPGVELVDSWWKRNLFWAANIAAVSTSPNDRLLVVCGASHASLLRSLLRDSLEFEVVDTAQYLP